MKVIKTNFQNPFNSDLQVYFPTENIFSDEASINLHNKFYRRSTVQMRTEHIVFCVYFDLIKL